MESGAPPPPGVAPTGTGDRHAAATTALDGARFFIVKADLAALRSAVADSEQNMATSTAAPRAIVIIPSTG